MHQMECDTRDGQTYAFAPQEPKEVPLDQKRSRPRGEGKDKKKRLDKACCNAKRARSSERYAKPAITAKIEIACPVPALKQ